MSFSETSNNPILGKRSRTLSERVTENGDPLVVKKKARAAGKASESTTKKITKACLYTFYFKIKLTFYIRKRVSKRLMMKIIFGLRKRFLKKDLASLNVQMEVMTTHRLMLTPATNRKLLTLRPQKMRRVLRKVPRPSSVSVREHESVSKSS
jgi:hypothetical protein